MSKAWFLGRWVSGSLLLTQPCQSNAVWVTRCTCSGWDGQTSILLFSSLPFLAPLDDGDHELCCDIQELQG